MNRPARLISLLPLLLLLKACNSSSPSTATVSSGETESCALDGEALALIGEIAGGTEKAYFVRPFHVPNGTRRLELAYQWSEINPSPITGLNPNDTTVLDFGLWDEGGYRYADAFRGWSGNRAGRLDQGHAPIFIEADQAERGYTAGTINAGIWHVELGVPISSSNGANYEVHIRCLSEGASTEKATDPVDPDHVANPNPGWYHGDLHMHGYHSHPAGADAFDMAVRAREANLDILFYTEYVVVSHWDQIGAAQQANPDLLYFPGREIITYRGHANALGETRGFVEYRSGFENISMREIQQSIIDKGALFQINHPTTFAIPGLESLCRGCQWDYEDETDWSQVHSMELVTGPIIVTSGQISPQDFPLGMQNPFTQPAIDLWHQKLQEGYKITAVSGSDSRGAEAADERNRHGYGNSATAILAQELSQAAVRQAIIDGKTFVKTLGVDESPHVELEAYTADGRSISYGGELQLAENESATLRLAIQNALGDRLVIYRNGQIQSQQLISSDDFVFEQSINRDSSSEGPLGSWWNYQIHSNQALLQNILVTPGIITAIGNPVFLKQ